MSSINNGRPPRTPGSVDTSANSNLSKIAKNESLFQGRTSDTDGDDAADKSGKGKSGKAGGKAHMHVKPAGLGSVDQADGAGSPSTLLGTNANQPSLLPDDSEPSATVGTSAQQSIDTDLLATDDLASTPDASDVVTQATTQLTTDLQQSGTTQATLQSDLTKLSAAMDQAGITLPIGTVVHDLVDPTGSGVAPSADLTAAAQAAGIDLSKDSTSATSAQTNLTQVLAADPVVTAAVDLATAHVARTSGLSGSDATADLTSVAKSLGSGDNDALAALYAAAAKMGVDLTDKDNDKESQAENSAATNHMKQADKQTYAQNAAASSSSGSGGGSSTSSGSASYGTGAAGNTNTYASISKSGSGTSAGGWDTTGNEAISPNPSNPIDFKSTYGISGGFSSVSMDDLLAQLPQLTSQYPNIKDILTSAANSVSPALPPQLLLSTLGVETSYATNYGNNAKDGPFQFIESTFQQYGSGDRTNMQDGANACAKYYRELLDQNGGDLYAAMRDYNGDVNQGASNSYQADQQKIFNGNANLE